MSHWFAPAVDMLGEGRLNLRSGLAALLVRPNSQAAAMPDAPSLAAMGGLSEVTASNYRRLPVEGARMQEGILYAEPVTWQELGGFENDTIGGVVLYLDGRDDRARVPVVYLDHGDGPFGQATNGGDITLIGPKGLLGLRRQP